MKPSREKLEQMFREAKDRYSDAVDAYKARDNRAERELKHAEYFRGRQELFETDQETQQPYNIVRPVIRDAAAEMMRHIPNVSVTAGRDDEAARVRAEMTERLMRSWMRDGTFDLLELESVTIWSRMNGVGYFKVFWDQDAGRPIRAPEALDFGEDEDRDWENDEAPEDDKEYDDFGEEVRIQAYEGDICTEFVPSYEGFPDPSQRNWKRWRYFLHRQVMTVDEAEARFPKDLWGGVPKFDVGEEMFALLYGDESTATVDTPVSKGNTLCEIVWYWEKANEKHRNGRLLIFSGGTALYAGRNPLDPVRLPFVPLIGDNRNPTNGGADGVTPDIIPHQDFTNFVVNKQKSLINTMANGVWYNPIGSGVRRDSFVNEDGVIIDYHKGMKPERDAGSEVPQSLFALIPQLQDQANRTSGYSDVARGAESMQGDEQSGRAVAFKTENQQRMREPEIMRFKLFVGWVLEQMLLVAKQQYDEGRLIRILGESGGWMTMEWSQDELMLDGELVVEIFSGAPATQAARMAEIMESMGVGLFSDTPEAERARKMLGDRFTSSATFDPYLADRNKIRRQLTALRKDPLAEEHADAFDDHGICLDEINRFRKTGEYDGLRKNAPEIAAKIDELAEEHEFWDEMQEIDAMRRQGGGMASVPGEGSAPGGTPPTQPGVESPADGGQEAYPGALPQQQELLNRDPLSAQSREQQG